MNGNEQTVDMKNRQRVNQHIALCPAPVVLQHLCIAQQIAVRQHRALAAARGAAGVQNRRQVISLTHHDFMLVAAVGGAIQQRAGAVVIERKDMLRAGGKRQFAEPAEIGAAANHHRRLCIADEIVHLGTLVGGVQWQKHVAGAQGGQVKHHRLDRFFNLHGNARAVGQLERLQQVGHHGGAALQVAPRIQQAVVGFNRHVIKCRRKGSTQRGKQVGVVHGIRDVKKNEPPSFMT